MACSRSAWRFCRCPPAPRTSWSSAQPERRRRLPAARRVPLGGRAGDPHGNALTSTTPTGVAAVVLSDSNFPTATPGAGYSSPPLVTFDAPTVAPNACTAGCVTATGTAGIGLGAGSFPSIFNCLGIEVRVMVRRPFAPLTSPDRPGRDDPGAWVRAHSSGTCDRLRRWEGR